MGGGSVLLALAALAWAGWLACYALVMLATRPVLRHPAPEQALPPPAIAALLCPPNGKVPQAAVTATLLDLIARGVVEVARDGAGQQWYRPSARPPVGLLACEAHVRGHVAARTKVAGTAVPAAALKLESTEHAKRWYERFTELVISDARDRQWVRDRARWPVRALLRLALLVPAGLAGAAAVVAHHSFALFYVLVGYSAATMPVRLLKRQVPRGDGVPVAARCRALRDQLARQPSTGDRLAGYAMAFGLTPLPRDASPFAPGGDVVWSPRTGRWLRVVSGRGVMSGLGPGVILALIVPTLLFSAIWAVLLGYLTLHLSAHWILRGWPVPLLGLGWLVWGTGNFFFLRRIWFALQDLARPPQTLVGQVVYLESNVSSDSDDVDTFYVALDDGSGADHVTRYPIGRALHDRLRYGSWLRLQVRPKTGAVLSAEVLDGRSAEQLR